MDKLKTKNRGGRKQLPANEVRAVRLQPGFSMPEIETLEARAEALGLGVIEYIRAAALGQQIKSVPAVNRAAYAETAQLAGNLNQLSKKANEGGKVDAELAQLLTKVYDNVQALRLALCGGMTHGS